MTAKRFTRSHHGLDRCHGCGVATTFSEGKPKLCGGCVDNFEERAAIMEYDSHMTREKAEELALDDVKSVNPSANPV